MLWKARTLSRQRSMVVASRVTGPTDPELTGHRRHAVELFTDVTADLPARPLRERGSHPDLARRLRPRAPLALLLAAAPRPLRPHDHRRHAGDRQVADRHVPASVAHGPHPTGRAPRPISRGLHEQPMLTVTDDLCLHHEAVQPDKRDRARLHHYRCPRRRSSRLQMSLSAEWRDLRLAWWTLTASHPHDSTPTLNAWSPQCAHPARGTSSVPSSSKTRPIARSGTTAATHPTNRTLGHNLFTVRYRRPIMLGRRVRDRRLHPTSESRSGRSANRCPRVRGFTPPLALL